MKNKLVCITVLFSSLLNIQWNEDLRTVMTRDSKWADQYNAAPQKQWELFRLRSATNCRKPAIFIHLHKATVRHCLLYCIQAHIHPIKLYDYTISMQSPHLHMSQATELPVFGFSRCKWPFNMLFTRLQFASDTTSKFLFSCSCLLFSLSPQTLSILLCSIRIYLHQSGIFPGEWINSWRWQSIQVCCVHMVANGTRIKTGYAIMKRGIRRLEFCIHLLFKIRPFL